MPLQNSVHYKIPLSGGVKCTPYGAVKIFAIFALYLENGGDDQLVTRELSQPQFNTCGLTQVYYPRRARSALGVDTVLTLDVCLYVC